MFIISYLIRSYSVYDLVSCFRELVGSNVANCKIIDMKISSCSATGREREGRMRSNIELIDLWRLFDGGIK